MKDRDKVTESSGRWDASGNIVDAVYEEREKAFKWAKGLNPSEFHWAITVMASDTNAFTLYERKALLEVAALKLDPRKMEQSRDDDGRQADGYIDEHASYYR